MLNINNKRHARGLLVSSAAVLGASSLFVPKCQNDQPAAEGPAPLGQFTQPSIPEFASENLEDILPQNSFDTKNAKDASTLVSDKPPGIFARPSPLSEAETEQPDKRAVALAKGPDTDTTPRPVQTPSSIRAQGRLESEEQTVINPGVQATYRDPSVERAEVRLQIGELSAHWQSCKKEREGRIEKEYVEKLQKLFNSSSAQYSDVFSQVLARNRAFSLLGNVAEFGQGEGQLEARKVVTEIVANAFNLSEDERRSLGIWAPVAELASKDLRVYYRLKPLLDSPDLPENDRKRISLQFQRLALSFAAKNRIEGKEEDLPPWIREVKDWGKLVEEAILKPESLPDVLGDLENLYYNDLTLDANSPVSGSRLAYELLRELASSKTPGISEIAKPALKKILRESLSFAYQDFEPDTRGKIWQEAFNRFDRSDSDMLIDFGRSLERAEAFPEEVSLDERNIMETSFCGLLWKKPSADIPTQDTTGIEWLDSAISLAEQIEEDLLVGGDNTERALDQLAGLYTSDDLLPDSPLSCRSFAYRGLLAQLISNPALRKNPEGWRQLKEIVGGNLTVPLEQITGDELGSNLSLAYYSHIFDQTDETAISALQEGMDNARQFIEDVATQAEAHSLPLSDMMSAEAYANQCEMMLVRIQNRLPPPSD